MGKFDGRLHLYGAEWGCWRIDQNTDYYQGWDRMWFGLDKNPCRFATVKYTDKDGNGFFDYLEYDLDGDQTFETIVDLKEMGVDDRCELIDVSSFKYKDFINLMDKMADGMWNNAMQACKVAEHFRVNTGWHYPSVRSMIKDTGCNCTCTRIWNIFLPATKMSVHWRN